MTYVITVPDNLKVRTKADNEMKEVDVSFIQYLINNPLNTPAFGGSYEALVELQALIQTICTLNPGDPLELSQSQYETIAQMTLHPKDPYQPEIGIQILPFLTAIKNAEVK